MTNSMTGFAVRRGEGQGHSWRWELKSVNGRGLDLRLRMPDWIDGLEQEARKALGAAFDRGSVTVGLRVAALADGAGEDHLDWALARVTEVTERAAGRGLLLSPPTAVALLSMRPEGGQENEDTGPLRAALLADLSDCIADLKAARASEGAALHAVLEAHIAEIESLVEAARSAEAEAAETRRTAMQEAMARVLGNVTADEARLEQELALIAVKADISEELDRLTAHVAAARALLAAKGAKGRKLDFLTQELNREANTLCAKASSARLTEIGLEAKAVIDRIREQVQNVE